MATILQRGQQTYADAAAQVQLVSMPLEPGQNRLCETQHMAAFSYLHLLPKGLSLLLRVTAALTLLIIAHVIQQERPHRGSRCHRRAFAT